MQQGGDHALCVLNRQVKWMKILSQRVTLHRIQDQSSLPFQLSSFAGNFYTRLVTPRPPTLIHLQTRSNE